jgi:hypothetical protein
MIPREWFKPGPPIGLILLRAVALGAIIGTALAYCGH